MILGIQTLYWIVLLSCYKIQDIDATVSKFQQQRAGQKTTCPQQNVCVWFSPVSSWFRHLDMLLRSQGAGYFLVIIDEYVSMKYGGETNQPIQL